MQFRPLFPVLLMLVTAAAGCFGDDAAPKDEGELPALDPNAPEEDRVDPFIDTAPVGHSCIADKVWPRLYAPDTEGTPWVRGQWWEFSLAFNDDEPSTTRLVYYEDQDNGAHYMVGTPTRDEALIHALYSTNPMIGRVHRTLYSPHESGDHADMFHFPLCDGSTWNTRFFGEDFSMKAEFGNVSLPSPLGAAPGYIIRGTSAEGSTLAIAYTRETQWFTSIDLDRANGETVDMDLVGIGAGYKGPAHFLRAQKDAIIPLGNVTLPQETIGILREDGKDGTYDTIAMAIEASSAGPGEYQLELTAPDGSIAHEFALGGQADSEHGALLEVPYQAGNWTLTQTTLVPGQGVLPTIQVTGELRMVSIYDRSGST